MKLVRIIFLVVASIVPCMVVAAEPSDDERAAIDFFEKKIRPLFAKHCQECHSGSTAADSGQLALDGRAGLLEGGTRGPLFIAGKPDESLLITAVRYTDTSLQMPPDKKLATEEINDLVKWVQSGAVIPDYGTAVQKKGKEIDWNEARQFWSFQPLKNVVPPELKTTRHVDQPIDLFIQEQLSQQGLEAAPVADRRTLIRRLSFDLLGLPPSEESVQEFLGDSSDDAYERLIDRMLASPHFGERWARYWLDLARYTDVTPTWLKNADQAWMYRDWIIRALNEDLPYSTFVKQQLAADVLDQTAPEDYAALGLIGLSPTYWKELRLAPSVIEVIVADEWDERIDAVTRTFLGLTVACARCHDHKFDPITTRDYYGLAGIFASTQLTDRPLLPSPLAEQIADARHRVDQLEESLKAMKDQNSDEAKRLKDDMASIRSTTPYFDSRMAHTVEEASIFVLPDGPEMTKLDVKRNQSRDLPVFRRGNPSNPGEIVPRRFIEVLSADVPKPYGQGSGRREFAASLFQEARALTARVMVNRIWSNHFGRGLVRTPSDFGIQGDRPTHPDLLEWLANELINQRPDAQADAWRTKRIHRQMVSSTTYRQASQSPDEGSSSLKLSVQIDPENQWLSRMSRRRLDIEPWRDAMLAAVGNLDDRIGGPATELDQASNLRRTLYGKVGRDEQNDMLRLYDFPPPTSHSPARDTTTTPLQQLFILNSDFIASEATIMSARIASDSRRNDLGSKIHACYELLFQRHATDRELSLAKKYLQVQSTSCLLYTSPSPRD